MNDMLVDESPAETEVMLGADAYLEEPTSDYAHYYFNIEVDDEIPREELCEVVDGLDINDQFIDEELICPEQRTERFDIYASRVRPEDLEDCD